MYEESIMENYKRRGLNPKGDNLELSMGVFLVEKYIEDGLNYSVKSSKYLILVNS
jgi:hypothetical protein